MHSELVLEVLPNLKLVMSASMFPAAALFPFISGLIKLTLCGRFPAHHASACTHFLNQRFSQNDIKFGFATLVLGSSELQIAALTRLFIAFKRLLEVSLPFMDPAFIEKTKSSSISFISIPRYVLRFIQCAWADACVPFVIDTIPIEASTLLGWCSIKQGPLLPSRTVPVAHGVVLSSLHRLDVGISSADISRRTRLDLQLVTCSNSSCNPQTVQHKP